MKNNQNILKEEQGGNTYLIRCQIYYNVMLKEHGIHIRIDKSLKHTFHI